MEQTSDAGDVIACATTPGESPANDRPLVRRIAAAFRHAMAAHAGAGQSMWTLIDARKHDVGGALQIGNLEGAARLLRDPANNQLFYGFDGLCTGYPALDEAARRRGVLTLYDLLTRVAEAVGAIALYNPEAVAARERHDVERLLAGIEAVLGCRLRFPNPFAGEFGLASSRGVITYRALHAVYQAWLVKRALPARGGRVLEIGGGLGRTAYYARLLGLRDYTIVDLPITGAAQAYFLGRVLGDRAVTLHGETRLLPGRRIRLMPPEALFAHDESDEGFDVVLNVDSLTEMDRSIAERYVAFARRRCGVLISINHEANLFTVRELLAAAGVTASRYPYWLREGYTEEVARFG